MTTCMIVSFVIVFVLGALLFMITTRARGQIGSQLVGFHKQLEHEVIQQSAYMDDGRLVRFQDRRWSIGATHHAKYVNVCHIKITTADFQLPRWMSLNMTNRQSVLLFLNEAVFSFNATSQGGLPVESSNRHIGLTPQTV